MPRPAAVVRQFLKDMGEAGGFIQIGQNARVLLGYKTPINGFYSFWVLYPELQYRYQIKNPYKTGFMASVLDDL